MKDYLKKVEKLQTQSLMFTPQENTTNTILTMATQKMNSKNIKILHINTRSIENKKQDIETLIIENNPDILCFNEMAPGNESFNMDGYESYCLRKRDKILRKQVNILRKRDSILRKRVKI